MEDKFGERKLVDKIDPIPARAMMDFLIDVSRCDEDDSEVGTVDESEWEPMGVLKRGRIVEFNVESVSILSRLDRLL